MTKVKPLIITVSDCTEYESLYVAEYVRVRHIIFVIAAVEPHLDQPLVQGPKAAASQDIKHWPVIDLF